MSAVVHANDREGSALSTEELIARVVALSQDMRTQVIGAVDRMQDINRGIHLLSMNARIEAARAGAAGAGFGVVGQELTRLSSNMKDAAVGMVRESQSMGAELDAVLRVLNEDVVARRPVRSGAQRHRYRRSQSIRAQLRCALVGHRACGGTLPEARHAGSRCAMPASAWGRSWIRTRCTPTW